MANNRGEWKKKKRKKKVTANVYKKEQKKLIPLLASSFYRDTVTFQHVHDHKIALFRIGEEGKINYCIFLKVKQLLEFTIMQVEFIVSGHYFPCDFRKVINEPEKTLYSCI